jgi:hypothetical protein
VLSPGCLSRIPDPDFYSANGRAGTRQAAGGHGLTVQYARTDPRKYSFAARTMGKWNRLPDEVKSAPTGKAFEEKLKRL